MLLRVVQFLLGAMLAGGGGYLAWTYRANAANIFPPGVDGPPVLLLAGLLGLTSGLVFLVSAVHPRPNQRRMLAEKTAREDAALGQAEDYYSRRARAADRDWRSGDVTPLARPEASKIPQPVAPPPATPELSAATPITFAAPSDVEPPPVEPPAAEPPRQRSLSMPPLTPKPTAPEAPPSPTPPLTAAPEPKLQAPAPPQPPRPVAKPVATATVEPAAAFPAQATLAPIPRATEPPPAAAHPLAPVASPASVAADDPHAAIRAAIQSGQLDEADRMLTAARDNATGLDLALLTGLAGDHAAVSGRQSHAKWLWRLALKRFGEMDAMNTPAAKAVAESLRQLG